LDFSLKALKLASGKHVICRNISTPHLLLALARPEEIARYFIIHVL